MAAKTNADLDAAMDAYARGEDAAFERVFNQLQPRLVAFLRRLAGKGALAEDLLQETFLRIHRARGSFGKGAAALPWAYAIARNCYIDFVRSKRSRAHAEASDDEDAALDVRAGPDADAEQTAIVLEAARIVDRELQRMTLARREAFVLLRYEGLSVAEAARVLGATESAVKLRAFHAYEALRAALREAGVDVPTGKDAKKGKRE